LRSTRQRACCSVVFLLTLATAAGAQTRVPTQQPAVRWHDVSIDDYRQHLTALSALVDACAKARNVKGCDPALIGPDDRVPILIGSRSEARMVRYGWLRVLFSEAQDADQQPAKNTAKKAVSTKPNGVGQELPSASQLLKDAKIRLERDLAQSQAPEPLVTDHAQERATMEQVLAGPEFRNLKQATVSDSVLEKLGRWLNKFFESAASLKAHSAWLGRALVWGFILGVCVALVYSLVRLERRWRVRLTPDDDRPAPGAASARDWQLWLEDARRCAALGQWREAIHFVYWAAISRLESRRLWPADRARTPREYLALVAPEDPRRPGLSQLTSTFERFWYGGRPAAESDYKNAETVASTLMSGSGASPNTVRANATTLPTASEGGAQ
jgi:Domain of unknown function (DUF4129)